jgi:hypothetical protein
LEPGGIAGSHQIKYFLREFHGLGVGPSGSVRRPDFAVFLHLALLLSDFVAGRQALRSGLLLCAIVAG